MLKPAENSAVSRKPISFFLINAMITKPGTNAKYTNPRICLATGMFRKTAMFIANWKNSTIAKNCFGLTVVELDKASRLFFDNRK